MGMYDSIDCQYTLPMPEDPKGYTGSYGFQTKDFECALDIYIIDKDGQLSVERRETEWIEGDPNGKTFLEKTGYGKTVKTWLEPLNNTCTIQFYDYRHSNNTDYDYWIQYVATFVGGKLTDIKLLNFEATSNTERKKSDKEFFLRLEERRDFIQTWRYKYIYGPYNTVVRAVVRGSTKCLTKLNSLIQKLESKIKI
jgi:hypothetical protein